MKRKALTITLAAVMAMGTCAVTASAADGDNLADDVTLENIV